MREIIDYIRKKDSQIEIELTTNGIFLENAILNWLKNCRVNLSISIDGDEKTQLLNRKGTSARDYKKLLRLTKKLLASDLIINVVVSPNTVDKFFQNFIYLYNLGIKRFNFLPATYLSWKGKELKLLENQLNLISFFIQNHSQIYVKNIDINNDLFFFNTGIIIDTNGDVFFTNAIMLKEFQKAKKELKISNVRYLNSFNFLNHLDAQKEIEKIKLAIQKSIPLKIIKSNQTLDNLLSNFVEKIKANPLNKRVDIKIGYQCNNHCLFCVQGDKRKKCSFRKKIEIERDLIEARKTCHSLVFTGGEPTVHPNFLDLVRFAKKLNFKTIQIQTNARMFSYKKLCQETIKVGANEFSPAIHGHTTKLHDYLTTSPGSFKQTVQGIKNLKALGQRIITNTVINKFNYRYLPEIAKLLVFLNVDQFQFAFLHIVGSAWKNRNFIVPKKSEIMPYVKKGLDIGISAGKRVMTEAIPLCFMKGYEQYVAERIIPEAMVIENKFKIEDYKKYRQTKGKIKGEKCKSCLYFSICEGPWREYPEIFGWNEFKPVIKI